MKYAVIRYNKKNRTISVLEIVVPIPAMLRDVSCEPALTASPARFDLKNVAGRRAER